MAQGSAGARGCADGTLLCLLPTLWRASLAPHTVKTSGARGISAQRLAERLLIGSNLLALRPCQATVAFVAPVEGTADNHRAASCVPRPLGSAADSARHLDAALTCVLYGQGGQRGRLQP